MYFKTIIVATFSKKVLFPKSPTLVDVTPNKPNYRLSFTVLYLIKKLF